MATPEIKRIRVDLSQKPKDDTKKSKEKEKLPPKKRVITQTDVWTFRDFTHETQLLLLEKLHAATELSPEMTIIMQQIQAKRQGYKQQDVEKGLLDVSQFIETHQIIELLHTCRLCCFYCKEPAHLVYETVRDPKQWSLERIDNGYGHNFGNVEIACLACNVRRRTIYHERYIATKQMSHIVKLDTNNA